MTPADLYTLFRAEVNDREQTYLWSDTEVYSYMDDAQKMFCRLGGGISDATTTAVTTIAVPAGTEYVDIDKRILKIRSVRRADDRDVELMNFEDIQYGAARGTNTYGSADLRLNAVPGAIQGIVLGMEANKARLVQIPAKIDTLRLVVYRLPLTTLVSGSTTIEIDEQHHRHLLLWMKHLAHMKQDAETYDRGRADSFAAMYVSYCAQAKGEREKREHKYRSVGYGGIAMGAGSAAPNSYY